VCIVITYDFRVNAVTKKLESLNNIECQVSLYNTFCIILPVHLSVRLSVCLYVTRVDDVEMVHYTKIRFSS